MPGLVDTPAPAPVVQPAPGLGYSVLHQTVELDVEILGRSLKGKTTIIISPHSRDLNKIRLNCRQSNLTRLNINGKGCPLVYTNVYDKLEVHRQATVHQHHFLRQKIESQLRDPPEEELIVTLPRTVRIEEQDVFAQASANALANGRDGLTRRDTARDSIVLDSALPLRTSEPSIGKFEPLTINIEYTIDNIRDGMQFVGLEDNDGRYPHVYTRNSGFPGGACCLFPCVDNISSRCTWDISIKCHRTLGDALRRTVGLLDSTGDGEMTDGTNGRPPAEEDDHSRLSPEDRELEMTVICSGDITDEIVDKEDSTKKTVSFSVSWPLAPQQVGFAIGPFEYVNLAEFRESDEDENLGQNAIPVDGFCLPGRGDEVRNTCLPMAKAIDFFTRTYGSYPFSNYKMCFVDDLSSDTVDVASLSFCSSHLLFPEDIIDPIYDNTRHLVHALASQWIGINIIPKDPSDTWIVVGIAYFITDMFMKRLCGNNEYRYRQRRAADRVCELDYLRPSLSDIGTILALDPTELEFMTLKAPLVLFILDRRLTKASGSTGMPRIVSRVFLQAKTGDLPNAAVSTAYFTRTCEKLGHTKLDSFFQQWVLGAGCPRFRVTQRFNKKKLVVEMLIRQIQNEVPAARDLLKENFMRDTKEDRNEVYAAEVQAVFTGPMTIRIHEADGTPYEHIVEIKEVETRFEIPYNTKYKRLKRSRRAKERAAAAQGVDATGEGQDDVLLYCLGDVLQSEADVRDWQLSDWTKEDEENMGRESYEWIRMDSDFEWICKMSITMPGYMYTSQLQQDRDVVAQLESVQYLAAQNAHPLVSTILVRTLMDKRYFHGIRTTAARALVKHAKEEVNWVGLHHLEKAFEDMFCFHGSPMTRSNDFSDRAAYYIQCALPQIIGQVKLNSGKTPLRAKRFLYDKLKFNDNSNNEYSDCYYVSILIRALSECLTPRRESTADDDLDFNMDDVEDRRLEQDCIAEIDRYRRMDEWTPSYQNIYSRTALDCQRNMMARNVIDINLMHFLNYTRPGTLDLLRVNAFENLVELDVFQYESMMPWFLFIFSSDPSPYIRASLYRLFGKALATIAFGEDKQAVQPTGGLIIEQEAGTEARALDLARKQTIEGAMNALKLELHNDAVFKAAFWKAVTSPRLSFKELADLLEICAMLYDPINSVMVSLRYPRYWKVEYEGNGRCRFFQTNHVRTIKMPQRQWDKIKPPPGSPDSISTVSSAPATAPRPPLRLKFGRTASNSVIGTSNASSPASPAPPPPRTFFKPPKKPTDRPVSPAPNSPPEPISEAEAIAVEPPKKPQLKLKLSMRKEPKD